ncbi:MAG: 2-oxoglutarate dehydrogenase complex dihydrolipoyllysine-residue succinyltransferase [Tepidisphaeraceae bacterium]|jgi:2-oxoglutarate dehydrogenase E2 component (dihydrolipoamide succinyltransferase)
MAIQVKVPGLGESVKQAKLLKWHKQDGQTVGVDEPICELESDKANADVTAESAGIIHPKKREGEMVEVGDVIAEIDPTGAKSAPPAEQKKPAPAPPPPPLANDPLADFSPAVRRLVAENQLDPKSIPATGPKGRLTREDVQAYRSSAGNRPEPAAGPIPAPTPQAITYDSTGIHRAPMSKIRKRIAETLLLAQRTAAILTTFNEVDLTSILELRNKFKDRFQEVHGVGLGLMSFFARACVLALKEFPKVNAFIEGDDVIYHQFVNLGIAVSTERGLAVPVLRNAEKMSFAKIESEIKRLAGATRDGKLSLEELSGGTFTITNGGIFGSLLSTPILNPPQSGILGMHAIQKRPVALNDKIEIRSMMYLALSYDHRLVDGRESVSFLVRLKQYLEEPTRQMLEI